MIYLDSAATSLQKPPEVARAVTRAMQSCASPGRGDHAAAMRAAETVFACREEAAALFHMTQPENVGFTMNATHALNIAILYARGRALPSPVLSITPSCVLFTLPAREYWLRIRRFSIPRP